MSSPLDTPLYRRPWPDDTYERVHADTFHIGGWYDFFIAETIRQYTAMREVAAAHGSRPPQLVVGPWTHGRFGNVGQIDFGLAHPGSSSAAAAASTPTTCAGSTRR